jgi:CMP-N-acetylneuraminic acid synthetase
MGSTEIEDLEAQAAGDMPTCIILAKGKSKRLPHKNKLPINGKPLVQYAIEAALESKIFGSIIVSSDDEDILEIAYDIRATLEDRGRITLHKRPKGLVDCQMKDVIRYLEGIYKLPSVICILTPCNPFRTAEDLQNGYKLLKEKDANYVMSVKPMALSPEYAIYLEKGMIKPKENTLQTQKYPQAYYHDGAFIFAKPKIFEVEYEYGFYGSKNYPYVTPHVSIDIDTKEQFRMAEYFLVLNMMDDDIKYILENAPKVVTIPQMGKLTVADLQEQCEIQNKFEGG